MVTMAQSWADIWLALLEYGLLCFFLLFLTTRIAWWCFKAYLPSRHALRSYYRHLKGSYSLAKELWEKKPEMPVTVRGFLVFVFWFGLGFLNLFLLGQIMEVVIESGRRIFLGPLGSYDILALLTGAVWMLAQVFIGDTCYMISQSSKLSRRKYQRDLSRVLPRWGWYALLIVAVVTEGALAAYRGYLLAALAIPPAHTFVDVIIMGSGPVVSGLVGIVVPFAEVGAGVAALEEFVEGAIFILTRKVVSFVLLAYSGFLRVVFCFHPEPPHILLPILTLPSIKRLDRE